MQIRDTSIRNCSYAVLLFVCIFELIHSMGEWEREGRVWLPYTQAPTIQPTPLLVLLTIRPKMQSCTHSSSNIEDDKLLDSTILVMVMCTSRHIHYTFVCDSVREIRRHVDHFLGALVHITGNLNWDADSPHTHTRTYTTDVRGTCVKRNARQFCFDEEWKNHLSSKPLLPFTARYKPSIHPSPPEIESQILMRWRQP